MSSTPKHGLLGARTEGEKVYEGMLDRTVARLREVKKELTASKQANAELRRELDNFWFNFLTDDHLCGLCGNRGMFSTSIVTPAGHRTGIKGRYCICPNGRALKINAT